MKKCARWSLAAVVILLTLAVAAAQALSAVTELVSFNSSGLQGNSSSLYPSISADGRFVAFISSASNLVPSDTNNTFDVFVRDRMTGQTEIVSVSSQGIQGNNTSAGSCISADGRFVAFHSRASNLVPSDTNGYVDVFIHDRMTGQTEIVSVSSQGVQGNGDSYGCALSADGRFVAFRSDASNLVPDDTNGYSDMFVHDRVTGQTERVSVSSQGVQGNGDSFSPSISADGRFVAFWSDASNFVPDDTNGQIDIFVHDRVTGQTERVSVSSEGVQGNYDSGFYVSISADGRFVAFDSDANNLTPGVYYYSNVFVHDRVTSQTERVSISPDPGTGNSYAPSISADGRFVAFYSDANNLVPGDTNYASDVFVHDRMTRQTTRVSVSSEGLQGNGNSFFPSISADGRFVAFYSDANNLVPGDTNYARDIFVHDRGEWFQLSISFAGTGSGVVKSLQNRFNCSASCSQPFPPNMIIKLWAAPSTGGSIFSGWLGDADCGDGVVTMSSDTSCIATFDFCSGKPARIVTDYDSISLAYGGAASGDTIEVIASNQQENLEFDQGKIVTLLGGFDCSFNPMASYTTITGYVIVVTGTLTVSDIAIQ
jgi:Tol biopolymer transport system component